MDRIKFQSRKNRLRQSRTHQRAQPAMLWAQHLDHPLDHPLRHKSDSRQQLVQPIRVAVDTAAPSWRRVKHGIS